MSPGEDVSCSSCHIDKFGSADGLKNAVGIGGVGQGIERLDSKGRIVPRNTLPFWGRGGIGFNTFFWDGKVSVSSEGLTSQFGQEAPSTDPLVISAMLPPVEVDEMVGDVGHITRETVDAANILYKAAVERLADDKAIASAAKTAFGKEANELEFLNFAEAIAAFIRENFKIKETRFHSFVFSSGAFTDAEVAGGLIFYGKGQCSQCHNGPYFSDLDFHAIPSPNTAFGKNGFGVDYGRFNVTLNPEDLGKFRTPPLYNVVDTSPYGHSGAYRYLEQVILAHSDPLAVLPSSALSTSQRHDLYSQLRAWSQEPVSQSILTKTELSNLISFLNTLNYKSAVEVNSD